MSEFLLSFWQTYNTLIYTLFVHGCSRFPSI